MSVHRPRHRPVVRSKSFLDLSLSTSLSLDFKTVTTLFPYIVDPSIQNHPSTEST